MICKNDLANRTLKNFTHVRRVRWKRNDKLCDWKGNTGGGKKFSVLYGDRLSFTKTSMICAQFAHFCVNFTFLLISSERLFILCSAMTIFVLLLHKNLILTHWFF